jgi:hypothetical protein
MVPPERRTTMALRWEDIQRLKYETGYNVANVGAELYVLNGYAAVFDSAIAPYLQDQGSTSSTSVLATDAPANVAITLASNPAVGGNMVGAGAYGNVFQVGSKVVVDVGPNQETDVIIQAISGLVVTVQLTNAHNAPYPVVLQAGEFIVRRTLERLDVIDAQLRGYAPAVAGLAKADEVEFHANKKGRSGQQDPFQSLMDQRDMGRRDLCSLLGIENLWEKRNRHPVASNLSYGRY